MPGKKKWPESKIREIIALYHEGYGTKRIARRTGVPFYTVRDILMGRSRKEVTGGKTAGEGQRPRKELHYWSGAPGVEN